MNIVISIFLICIWITAYAIRMELLYDRVAALEKALKDRGEEKPEHLRSRLVQ